MIIDLHSDTIEKMYDENLNFYSLGLSVNINKIKCPYIQTFGTFIHPKYNINRNGYKRANDILNDFYNKYPKEKMFVIKSKNDFYCRELSKKIGALLSIENGDAIAGNLNNIDKLYNKGIRMMSVVWNEDNELGTGAETKSKEGLTKLGKQYIEKLQNKNIIIDVSHMSEKSFYDTISITEVPIIASHSCVYNLCKHNRNLNDDQIKQIARKNGVIGICFCSSFLNESNNANVEDIVKHIDYIANLVGIDYVSLGSDFDGLSKEHIMKDIKGVEDVYKIITELEKRGYTKENIDKITHKNFLRVVDLVLH